MTAHEDETGRDFPEMAAMWQNRKVSVTSVHQFAEKVSLVTDITDPIGRAAALQLALQGSYVIGGVPKGSPDDGGLAEELRSLGTLALTAEYIPSTADGAKELVDVVKGAFGRLDILVNCLKIGADSAFFEPGETSGTDDGISDPVADAAIGLMGERPKPRMVFVFQWAATEASGSKHESQLAATFVMKLVERSPKNFRVNAVETVSGTESRLATAPDDVARVILFLLSSEATAVNGQSIMLTGGRT